MSKQWQFIFLEGVMLKNTLLSECQGSAIFFLLEIMGIIKNFKELWQILN